MNWEGHAPSCPKNQRRNGASALTHKSKLAISRG